MEDHPLSNTFTWKIKKFSDNGRRVSHTTVFSAIGYKWCIVACPSYIETGYLSIYLYFIDYSVRLPYGWSRSAEIRLSLINQIDSNLSLTKEAQHEFNRKDIQCGFREYIPLSKLNDPKEGYLVNGTCIIEAVVAVPRSDHKRKRVTLQQEAITIPDVKTHQRIPLLYGANSRTTPIAPPSNLTKPSSTLKKRSKIACTILNGFMLEFAEDFPTLEKFEQVMKDIRATMYGGKMGDIFEEWRPRTIEIEGLLADIDDMEQQSEALQSGALFKLEESLADVRQATLEKWKEFKSAETKAAPAEKLKALKEIKKLNQQEGDAISKIEDVVAGAEESKKVIAEKKAKIVEWFSNPFPQQHS